MKMAHHMLLAVQIILGISNAGWAERARIAVAANFAEPARALARAVSSDTAHEVNIIMGSTGALATQISQGAPYHLFLAADRDRPAWLVTQGHGAMDDLKLYAVGRPVLWHPKKQAADWNALMDASFILAIANPQLAPYGKAAEQILARKGVQPRLVMGENVSQALNLAFSGHADGAITALSAVFALPAERQGVWLTAPAHWHDPVEQYRLLLKAGKMNDAALAFLTLLDGPEGSAVLGRYGYGAPQS